MTLPIVAPTVQITQNDEQKLAKRWQVTAQHEQLAEELLTHLETAPAYLKIYEMLIKKFASREGLDPDTFYFVLGGVFEGNPILDLWFNHPRPNDPMSELIAAVGD